MKPPADLPLRALPRIFLPGVSAEGEIELPGPELDRLRKVLRLTPGAQIAILPGDGSLVRCELLPRTARPISVERPATEPPIHITLAQALPKADKLEEIVRACTEIGVSRFVLFPSERTVVKWDAGKLEEKLKRLGAIARESCEVSFRTRLPALESAGGLREVLKRFPSAQVLSEVEGVGRRLDGGSGEVVLVVGPEGGWAPREVALIGEKAVTLGPRVLRVEHAGAAAAAVLLLGGLES
jgi:16S rRNA (uracil1498-N3)-methyltransferase